MIINESRKIDNMINDYQAKIEEFKKTKTTTRKVNYNDGFRDGAIEALEQVISDLKKLKEC